MTSKIIRAFFFGPTSPFGHCLMACFWAGMTVNFIHIGWIGHATFSSFACGTQLEKAFHP